MKTLLFAITALLLGASCKKESIAPVENCYTCTDVEKVYQNGVLVKSTSIASYTTYSPSTDTLKTVGVNGLLTLRYMDCKK